MDRAIEFVGRPQSASLRTTVVGRSSAAKEEEAPSGPTADSSETAASPSGARTPRNRRRVLSHFFRGQADVFLTTVFRMVQGLDLPLARHLAQRMSPIGQLSSVLPAHEVVLRQFKCAKVTADRLRRKFGTLYVCARHVVFDSAECRRKTIPYGVILHVLVQKTSAKKGPTMRFSMSWSDPVTLTLANFESAEEARECVGIMSVLCDVHIV